MPAHRAIPPTAVLLTAGLCWAPTAVAEPPPPPAPQPPPGPSILLPTAGIGNALAQRDQTPSGPFGLPDLSAVGPGLLLGQASEPSPPGAPAAEVPPLNALSPLYLNLLNAEPAAPGEGVPAPGIGPSPEDPGTGRIAFLRRLHEMYQAGLLDGALLGQLPKDAAGQPVLPPSEPDPVG